MRGWARRDYRFWPYKEAVTVLPAGTGTADAYEVAVAQRVGPVGGGERAPMGARYLSREIRWYVPGPKLPAGVTLLEGDVLRANLTYGDDDSGTVDWVVQRADFNPFDEVWTLEGLLLSLHPRLSELITIQRPVITVDDAGGEVFDWGDVAGVPNPAVGVYVDEPAAVLFLGGDHTTFNAQVGDRERWEIVVGRQLTLTARDRVLYRAPGGVLVLDIDDFQNSGRIDEFPKIVCSRQP